MRAPAVVLSLLLLLPGLNLAEEPAASPSLTVEVEPLQATVGERLQTLFTLSLPEGWEAELPEIGPEFGQLSVISGSWQGPEQLQQGVRWVWSGQLTAFTTGALEIPSVSVQLRTGEESSTLTSAPVAISIISTLEEVAPDAEQPEISDLKPPLSIPAEYALLLRAVAILAALLAASALAWWLHRRYARKLAAAAVPEDPFHRMAPHLWVYKALQELLDKRLEEQGLLDLFYSELSWILKRYTGGRYRLDLLEKTTEEIPHLLRQAGVAERSTQKISSLLVRCDQVKFAKSRPGPDERKEAVEAIYAVVDATKPAEADEREPRKGAA